MRTRIARVVVCAVISVAGLTFISAGASNTPSTPSIINISSLGGSRTIFASVQNARTCVWSSNPRIVKFDVVLKCKTGMIARTANFSANPSNIDMRYTITLTVVGEKTKVHRWKVVEAGKSLPTTTVSPTPTATTTTTTPTTSTPYTYTYTSGNLTFTCTGDHVVTAGQPPKDIQTCLAGGNVTGVSVGTFSNSLGSASGYWPVAAWGEISYISDYYKAPTTASSWSIDSINNGNGTFTWNMTAVYAGLTVPFTPGPTVSTSYNYGPTSSWPATCTGEHVVTAGQPPKDIETCIWSGNVTTMTAGTFSSNPDSPYGTWPVNGWGQPPYISDYYSAPVEATSWSIVSIHNGNGTFTWNMTAYYNGLSS